MVNVESRMLLPSRLNEESCRAWISNSGWTEYAPSTKHTTPSHSMMLSVLSYLSLVLVLGQVQALYFYIDGPTQKCFFEE